VSNDAPKRLPDLPALWDDSRFDNPLDTAAETPREPLSTPPDPWAALRRHTPARIALGRAGTSLPTSEVLRFAAAHAQARDAVHQPLDAAALEADLRARGHDVLRVRSRAASRAEYIVRPDLGRALDEASRSALASAREAAGEAGVDLCIVIGDGLSAIAAQRHAAPLVEALAAALAAGEGAPVRTGAVVVATQARVAIADEIGALLGASLALMLIGERPGLSSPDSLGAYLTWAPVPGRADAERNCVSNIRPAGLPAAAAAARLAWLVRAALRRRVTGLGLKDDSETPALESGAAGDAPPALPNDADPSA
jgi:ethanolamine ammonia-lyase small subunit